MRTSLRVGFVTIGSTQASPVHITIREESMRTTARRISTFVLGIDPHYYRLILTFLTLSMAVIIGGAPANGGNVTG